MNFLELGYNLDADKKRASIRNDYNPMPAKPESIVDRAVDRHWRLWALRHDEEVRKNHKEIGKNKKDMLFSDKNRLK